MQLYRALLAFVTAALQQQHNHHHQPLLVAMHGMSSWKKVRVQKTVKFKLGHVQETSPT
jgi:hypothetical protein